MNEENRTGLRSSGSSGISSRSGSDSGVTGGNRLSERRSIGSPKTTPAASLTNGAEIERIPYKGSLNGNELVSRNGAATSETKESGVSLRSGAGRTANSATNYSQQTQTENIPKSEPDTTSVTKSAPAPKRLSVEVEQPVAEEESKRYEESVSQPYLILDFPSNYPDEVQNQYPFLAPQTVEFNVPIPINLEASAYEGGLAGENYLGSGLISGTESVIGSGFATGYAGGNYGTHYSSGHPNDPRGKYGVVYCYDC